MIILGSAYFARLINSIITIRLFNIGKVINFKLIEASDKAYNKNEYIVRNNMPKVKIDDQELYSFYDAGDMPAYNFANYAKGRVTIDGIRYPTREHAFQAYKLPPHERLSFLQKCGPRANDARLYFKGAKTPPGWHKGGSRDAMYNVVRAFADQDESFKGQLLGTGNIPIVEDTAGANYRDDTWGCGYKGDGENRLGEILMQVRAEMQGRDRASALLEAQRLNQISKSTIMTLGDRSRGSGVSGTLLQDHPDVSIVRDMPKTTIPYREGSAAYYVASGIAKKYRAVPQIQSKDDGRKGKEGKKQFLITFDDPKIAEKFCKDNKAYLEKDGRTVSMGEEKTKYFAQHKLKIMPGQVNTFMQELSAETHTKPKARSASPVARAAEEIKSQLSKVLQGNQRPRSSQIDFAQMVGDKYSTKANIGAGSQVYDKPEISSVGENKRFEFKNEKVATAFAKEVKADVTFDSKKECLVVIIDKAKFKELETDIKKSASQKSKPQKPPRSI